MELEEISVPEFSVGRLLLPRLWTVDTHSQYVPLSHLACLSLPEGSDTLPPGSSSNTVRAERLDRSGDTVYVTEVYIPRARAADENHVGAKQAKTQNAHLSSVPPRREERPPLQVWVRAIESESNVSPRSIAGQLLPFYHVFLQVVLDVFEGPSCEMATMADAILRDAVEKLTMPLGNLCTTLSSRSAVVAVKALTNRKAEQEKTNWWNSARARQTGEDGLAFHVGAYTKRGAAVVSIRSLLTDDVGTAVAAAHVEWNCGRIHDGRGVVREAPSGTCARLRHFIKHELRLNVEENLTFAFSRESDDGAHAIDEPGLEAVSIATFPVFSTSSPCSLHNYLSVEQSFEGHVRASLQARHKRHHASGLPTEGGIDAPAGWELFKVCSSDRFIPTEAYMRAVSAAVEEEASLQFSAEHVPRQQMLAVPPRYTLYTLRTTSGGTTATFVAQLVAPRVQSDSAIVIIAGIGGTVAVNAPELARRLPELFAVGFPSTHFWTSVLRTAALSSSSSSFLFRQGQLSLRLASGDRRYHGVHVVPTAGQSFSTLGSLTVVRVRPPTNVEKPGVEPVNAPLSSSEASSPSCSPSTRAKDSVGAGLGEHFAVLAASWTLVADGRSAADYLDYILTESYYDSGVFNLNNVAQRTTALKGHRDSLWVRERGKNAAYHLKSLQQRRSNEGPNLLNGVSGDAWSAWVDLNDSRRAFICTQEKEVGQVLIVQACIEAPRELRKDVASAKPPEMERMEEADLETWIFGVAVGTSPLY